MHYCDVEEGPSYFRHQSEWKCLKLKHCLKRKIQIFLRVYNTKKYWKLICIRHILIMQYTCMLRLSFLESCTTSERLRHSQFIVDKFSCVQEARWRFILKLIKFVHAGEANWRRNAHFWQTLSFSSRCPSFVNRSAAKTIF